MNELRSKLIKFIDNYAEELSEARKTEDYKRPFGKFVRHDIVESINKIVDPDKYKVKGSVGAGRWTDVPWVAVFDKRITESAQKGVYIVYLLNKDSKTLYLTLNQGATNVAQNKDGLAPEKLVFTGIASSSNTKTTSALKAKAETIRNIIGNNNNLEYKGIYTGSDTYDAGCIFYKAYTLKTIPNDEELYHDLKDFLQLYQIYYNKIFAQTPNKQEPENSNSLDEYDPGITKEQWLKILNNSDVIRPEWHSVLAAFYSVGGEATCKQIGDKFDKSPNSINATCIQLAKTVQKATGCPLFHENGKEKYWPILFLGKDVDNTGEGTFLWKLRSELYDALKEFDILRFLWKKKEDFTMISDHDAINNIKEYISSKGFTYPSGMIENFYLSLKSKPFVILAGISGTGKTRLVKLFAEAIGAKYQMVPVRPDWSDSSDLFGHVDLNGNYIPGPILGFISKAQDHPDTPYILCLDEMNLARVEYYLSDILSVIETRDFQDDEIVTDQLVSKEQYGTDKDALEKYGVIGFPQNLYLVGTVNMDETTFPFSRKVLDRANTIEFNFVDLMPPQLEDQAEPVEPLHMPNTFLQTRYLFLSQCKDRELVQDICIELQKINEILQRGNSHVGYRVRDEIVFYMLNNKESELLTKEEALDYEIMQKILPRIQGSSQSVKDILCDLFKEFAGDYEGYQTQSNDTASRMMTMVEKLGDQVRFPKSAKKAAFMVRRFEEDGYTSFWL